MHSPAQSTVNFAFFGQSLLNVRNKLHFHALVTHGKSSNRKCFVFLSTMQSVPLDKGYVAPNPFDENRPTFLCSDPRIALKGNFIRTT